MALVGGAFFRGSPVSPASSFRRRFISTSITTIGSRDLAVKSRPNLFTHSRKIPCYLVWCETGATANGLLTDAGMHKGLWSLDRLESKHLCFCIVFVIGLQFVRGYPERLWTNSKQLRKGWSSHVQPSQKCKWVRTAAEASKQMAPTLRCIGRERAERFLTCTSVQRRGLQARGEESRTGTIRRVWTGNSYVLVEGCCLALNSSSLRRTGLRAGSLPDFRTWESCLTMPLVGGFSRGSPVSPALSFRRSTIPLFTLIGSQDLDTPNTCTLVTFAIGSQFIRHALDDSEPIGNTQRVPHCQVWSNIGYSLKQQPMNKHLRPESTQDCRIYPTGSKMAYGKIISAPSQQLVVASIKHKCTKHPWRDVDPCRLDSYPQLPQQDLGCGWTFASTPH
ncbi:hypothetical protein PR048_029666 [Dryococelus australis]|uniref:Uncharacterized protein n=1 Tax=Dryococelus australis TaxID=614101 RepID=A0ABQ9GG20_9NEOP|nr:hypothetical protein PR048_029666 [Dryococelus australis]